MPGPHVSDENAVGSFPRVPSGPAPGAKPISTDDLVNHPVHYNSNPSGVEAIDVIEHMTFNVGTAMKYLWRCGLKNGEPSVRDLEKAAWYVNREIERLIKSQGS